MRSEFENSILTLFPEGHVDSKNAGEFERDAMTAADAAQEAAIVVDMTELKYISSAGLRVLMKLAKRSRETLQIINTSPEVYEVFEMTGFVDLMDVKERSR